MTDQVAAPAAPAAPAAQAATQAPAVQAPATQQAPAKPAAEAPAAPATQEVVPATWAKTGDDGLDMALGFIGQRGFGQDHPAVQAALQGNFDLLRAQLAGMGDKAIGYEAYVALAERAYKAEVQKQNDNEQESVKAVLSAVGSPENWAAIHAWAKANADEGERAEINAMLAAGPRQAKAAAIYLRDLYEQHAGTITTGARAVKQTAGAGTYQPSAGGPIMSAREYSQAVNELHKKLGHKMQGSVEYADLQARRRAGKRAGQ